MAILRLTSSAPVWLRVLAVVGHTRNQRRVLVSILCTRWSSALVAARVVPAHWGRGALSSHVANGCVCALSMMKRGQRPSATAGVAPS